ncbi:MAG: CPBP family intramembrane metalloprotease [Planctomycetaceae bacterium]|nr:CPBP family intramembrane metalloprotease [Planctomycetaceae bacterium]
MWCVNIWKRQFCPQNHDSLLAVGTKVSPRGPGIGESLGWFLFAMLLHVFGFALTAGAIAGIFVAAGISWNDLAVLDFLESQQLTFLAGEQFVFVTVVLLAAWFRLRGNLGHRLSSRPLPLLHLFLITCLVVPIAIFSGLLHAWGMQQWQNLLICFPEWNQLQMNQSMDVLRDLSGNASVWSLLLLFAIAPALGEEILFRGVIGRGLIHRLGHTGGILLTSLLFALAHGHPVHALAVFPIGLALHYVYLMTRSFWAPIYLHFCVNAFAVLQWQVGEIGNRSLSSPAILMIFLCLMLFVLFLWASRVRLIDQEGREWFPERPSLELPIELPLTMTFSSLPWRITVGGLVPLIGFFAALRWYG